jgi:hypothetical protein
VRGHIIKGERDDSSLQIRRYRVVVNLLNHQRGIEKLRQGGENLQLEKRRLSLREALL